MTKELAADLPRFISPSSSSSPPSRRNHRRHLLRRASLLLCFSSPAPPPWLCLRFPSPPTTRPPSPSALPPTASLPAGSTIRFPPLPLFHRRPPRLSLLPPLSIIVDRCRRGRICGASAGESFPPMPPATAHFFSLRFLLRDAVAVILIAAALLFLGGAFPPPSSSSLSPSAPAP